MGNLTNTPVRRLWFRKKDSDSDCYQIWNLSNDSDTRIPSKRDLQIWKARAAEKEKIKTEEWERFLGKWIIFQVSKCSVGLRFLTFCVAGLSWLLATLKLLLAPIIG